MDFITFGMSKIMRVIRLLRVTHLVRPRPKLYRYPAWKGYDDKRLVILGSCLPAMS